MSSWIRSHSEGWRLAVGLGVVLALAPLRAEGAPTEAARAQARVRFDEGSAAYARGDFRQALQAFEAAYALAPLPAFLFNVAQCHRQLGAYERAAFHYRRYLALSEKEPANAGLVKELLAEVEAKARGAEKERPKAERAKGKEARAEPRPERGALEESGRRAADIRTSRSLSAPVALPEGSPEPERPSLARKWWVWAGAGAVALAAGGLVYAASASEPRPATLGTILGR